MGAHCDFKVTKIKQQVRGTEFQLDNRGKSYLVRTPFIGRFNVYNTLAAIAGAAAAGIKPRDAVKALAEAPQVPGRLELVGTRDGVTLFVDYAHTPDALENVCSTLKDLGPNKLITVFGCGGDRDKSKRQQMGKIASELAHSIILTNDNPRNEQPENIIKDILVGVEIENNTQVILDRKIAINTAITTLNEDEVLLIAGKGHETTQIIGSQVLPFSDIEIALDALI